MTHVHGIGDLDIGARPLPLDHAAICEWTAANQRTHVAYDDIKEKAAKPASTRVRKSRAKSRGQ